MKQRSKLVREKRSNVLIKRNYITRNFVLKGVYRHISKFTVNQEFD